MLAHRGHRDAERGETRRVRIFHCTAKMIRVCFQHRHGLTTRSSAWVALCLAFVLHVVDEASTGFLSVYNPTVIAKRQRFAWFPMPTFEFSEWLFGLIVANLVLLALSPFAFRGSQWLRPPA